MKKLIQTLFINLVLTSSLIAQTSKFDVIIKKDNTKIEAIISELEDSIVKYKTGSNPSGPLYTINKSDIASILFRNGAVETYGSTDRITEKSNFRETSTLKEAPNPRNGFEQNILRFESKELKDEYKMYRAKGNHGMVAGIIFSSLSIVAIGAGGVLVSNSYSDSWDEDVAYDQYNAGLATIIGGTAIFGGIGTIGWIKMGRNRSKSKVIARELIRRNESFISFKVQPGLNLGNRAGYLSFAMTF